MAPRWTLRVTIGGTVAAHPLEAHARYGDGQPIGVCSVVLPLPLPGTVKSLADVLVEFGKDGDYFPVFTGTFRDAERDLSVTGKIATLNCAGPLYRMGYRLGSDKAFTGGARATAASLFTTARHLGNQSVAWYATPSPTGTSTSPTFSPSADSNFLWVAGRAHGSNSYDTSIGDLKIKDRSRIEVYQGGVLLGRGFMPELSEQWSSALDYTNDANWSDFEVFVACNGGISASGGNVTVKFVSGHKPGSSDYDEYEVKNVTYQTAGDTSLRNIVRGLARYAGLGIGAYRMNEVTDLIGAIIRLGGNGLVDHGQVRVLGTERPIDFANRLLGLFGFSFHDCPDGLPRGVPIRGTPQGSPAYAFSEGADNALGFRRTDSADDVFNAVAITGAQGTDQNQKPFAYSYTTASPPNNALIPNPPGVNTWEATEQLLTSNSLCQAVGHIQEDIHNGALSGIAWTSGDPFPLYRGQVVEVFSPTVGVQTNVFLTSLAYDFDAGGARMGCEGWTGSPALVTETDDPSPNTDDAQPGAPRPATEWRAFAPNAGVS